MIFQGVKKKPSRLYIFVISALAAFSTSTGFAQATRTYIPANTTFDNNEEGWVANRTTGGLGSCLKGNAGRESPCINTSYQPSGGDPQGYLRSSTLATANDATDIYGVSESTWDSPAMPLEISGNESVFAAKMQVSLRAETRNLTPLLPTVSAPFAAFRVTLIDTTINKVIGFRYENAAFSAIPFDLAGNWQSYSWDLTEAEKAKLLSSHTYQLRIHVYTTVYYQSMLTYNVHADVDNAKVVVDADVPPPPPPPTTTTTTTPTPPPTNEQPKPKNPKSSDGNQGDDQPIVEPADVPFDLSLTQCRMVYAYGAMQTITLPKRKAKVRIRRAATTMVTPKRAYSVWLQRMGKTKRKQIRRVIYRVNGKQIKTNRLGRATIGLKDLMPANARKHRLSVKVFQRRGKAKTINLTLTTKPCTVSMQASFVRAQLQLRIADWYEIRKVRFSLPKGMNVRKVKRKVRNAVKVKIGKKVYGFTSLGKGKFIPTSKGAPAFRLQARGRTVTLTGVPSGTRDISLIFKRSQKIVRASWLNKKKRAQTLLFRAYVTDSVTTRRADYRAYNTKKRIRKK